MSYEGRRIEHALQQEHREDRMLTGLADQAEALAAEWVPPNHIWKTLDNAGIRENRTQWFRRVTRELARRKRTQQEERDEIDQELEAMRKAQLYADARQNELRQPRSTWDPEHPENRLDEAA